VSRAGLNVLITRKTFVAPAGYQTTNNLVTEAVCVTVFQMAKTSVTTAYDISSASKPRGRTLNVSWEHAHARKDPQKAATI
jgi:hypothetical protein